MWKKENSARKEKKGENGERKQRGDSTNGAVEAPIGDIRFARLHTDPRFQRMPKNKTKVAIDSRFAHMFSDKAFNNPSADKRGIKSKKSSNTDPLRRYYKIDEEDLDDDKEEGEAGGSPAGDSITKKKKKQRGNKARNKKKEPDPDSDENTDKIENNQAEDLGLPTSKTQEVKSKSERVKAGGIAEPAGLEEIVESAEESETDGEFGDEEGREVSEVDDEDEEGSSSSSSSSDSEVDNEQEPEADEGEEKIPSIENETRRLAIMNMDWEHIRAVHLLVLMRSFEPKGGRVHSVRVYPSEFGIEQMKEEELHGPKSIFNDEEDEEDEEEGTDPEKLRNYEKAKLRYYYAVVECDTASTAAHLYKNCDGIEFERTSNTLDLRFIPDEMEFKRPPRDSASEIPADYKAIEYVTSALQHSNVKLTWDDDEPARVRNLRRNFNKDELNEMDFRAYVASSSESESDAEAAEDADDVDGDEGTKSVKAEDEKEKLRSKYRSLLTGSEEVDSASGKKKTEKGNLEIKFHTGLDELSEKLLAKTKKDKADETVWEAYLRRKKEKKNARKHKKAASDSDGSMDGGAVQSDDDANHRDDPFFSHGDEDPFDDPFFHQDGDRGPPAKAKKRGQAEEGKTQDLNGSKKEGKQSKKENAAREKKELEKQQAELELLLLDDHMVQRGEGVTQTSSVEDPGKKRKQDKKKKKKGKGKSEELQRKIASTADYDDPRFASLFTSPLFALDPTDPQFKKAGSAVTETRRRHIQSSKDSQEQLAISAKPDQEHGTRKRKGEMSSLVRGLKSKLQAKANGRR